MMVRVKQKGEHESHTVTRSTSVGTALSKREHTVDIELPAKPFQPHEHESNKYLRNHCIS